MKQWSGRGGDPGSFRFQVGQAALRSHELLPALVLPQILEHVCIVLQNSCYTEIIRRCVRGSLR